VFGLVFEPVTRAQAEIYDTAPESASIAAVRPPTVWQTCGHPCELIVLSARMLLEFVEVEPEASATLLGEGASVSLEQALKECDGISLTLKRVFIPDYEMLSSEVYKDVCKARHEFLGILRCLSRKFTPITQRGPRKLTRAHSTCILAA
jgi:hypothetical protein